MDVDDDASVRDGVRGVLDTHGRIDALVAAAGWGVAGAVEHTTIGEAKAQLETNFWGCVRTVQAVLPAMRAQRGGRRRRACQSAAALDSLVPAPPAPRGHFHDLGYSPATIAGHAPRSCSRGG
jgi:NAD(P)-dependent dehydrogenase (short-subunit alcohol dehydrogenase family)